MFTAHIDCSCDEGRQKKRHVKGGYIWASQLWAPSPWSTSDCHILSRCSSTFQAAGCRWKVETWCLNLSVPETQFGLKLLLSCFNLPHGGLNLEETSWLPLTYSDVTLMSSPWCPHLGGEWVFDLGLSLVVKVMCVSVNPAVDENVYGDWAACLWF